MLDSDKRAATSEAQARWQADYDRIAARFAGKNGPRPPAGEQRTTNSGIPLKPAYFPEDVADREVEAPGQYPFTRGNLAAQYQFMTWANQPVIGYGLP
jgi:methylmalonyl-CoA mutase, N-terminal domain